MKNILSVLLLLGILVACEKANEPSTTSPTTPTTTTPTTLAVVPTQAELQQQFLSAAAGVYDDGSSVKFYIDDKGQYGWTNETAETYQITRFFDHAINSADVVFRNVGSTTYLGFSVKTEGNNKFIYIYNPYANTNDIVFNMADVKHILTNVADL